MTPKGQRTSSSPLTSAFMGGGYATAAAGLDPSGGIAAARNYRSGNDTVSEFARFSKTGDVETAWVPIGRGASYMGAVGVALSGHALVKPVGSLARAVARPRRLRAVGNGSRSMGQPSPTFISSWTAVW